MKMFQLQQFGPDFTVDQYHDPLHRSPPALGCLSYRDLGNGAMDGSASVGSLSGRGPGPAIDAAATTADGSDPAPVVKFMWARCKVWSHRADFA